MGPLILANLLERSLRTTMLQQILLAHPNWIGGFGASAQLFLISINRLVIRVRVAREAFDLQPYGTEAMGVMRIEKGHVVHAELDGRTIPSDFGFDRMMRKSGDFVGRRALQREAFLPEARPALVGLGLLHTVPGR